jgi:hypothetical protein
MFQPITNKAFVIHSDTGQPVVECGTVTAAFAARDRLEVTTQERHHVVAAADMLAEPPVEVVA